MKEIKVTHKTIDLTAFITRELALSYGTVQKLYRKRDIKVNGVRVGASVQAIEGDLIAVYLPERDCFEGRILYEDEQVIVIDKPARMDTVEAKSELEKRYGTIEAVHRLDRNTSGVMIFARNLVAKSELDYCFKEGNARKIYHAEVVGFPNTDDSILTAYLYKDADASIVKISDTAKVGYVKIVTGYKVLERKEETSILEVTLYTGKTHQIRAHLAHIGYPILGDEKYGNTEINQRFHKRFQCLVCVCLSLEPRGTLAYLAGQVFRADDRQKQPKNNG